MSEGKSRFQAILDAEYARAARSPALPEEQPAPDVPSPEQPAPARFEPTDLDRLAHEQSHKGVVAAVRARAGLSEVPPPRVPYTPPRLPPPPSLPLERLLFWTRWWRAFLRLLP